MGADQEPSPALPLYLSARSCPMAEASHQLHRVPNAQESEAQKQRQGSQQGVVLVDLDRQTDRLPDTLTFCFPPPAEGQEPFPFPFHSYLPHRWPEASESIMPTPYLGHSAQTPSCHLVRPCGDAPHSPGLLNSHSTWRSCKKKLCNPLLPTVGLKLGTPTFYVPFFLGFGMGPRKLDKGLVWSVYSCNQGIGKHMPYLLALRPCQGWAPSVFTHLLVQYLFTGSSVCARF